MTPYQLILSKLKQGDNDLERTARKIISELESEGFHIVQSSEQTIRYLEPKRDENGVYYYTFGFPVPVRTSSYSKKRKPIALESGVKLETSAIYKFQDMEVGDSFPFSAEKHGSVRASASKFKKKFPQRKFRVHCKSGDAVGRAWRLE
jgi:hypothetical protein